jgi:hypothetical protein
MEQAFGGFISFNSSAATSLPGGESGRSTAQKNPGSNEVPLPGLKTS